MASGDIRDILEVNPTQQKSSVANDVNNLLNNTGNTSNRNKRHHSFEPVKRPQGVNREVWSLIYKDDREQSQLMPSEEPKSYKHPKARLRHGVRRWHWCPFNHPARSDSVQFSHWRPINDDINKEYPFAKFNKVFFYYYLFI
jgi:hypothetical protein